MTAQELLNKHNPVLVLFPQSPQEYPARKRPGAWLPGRLGWSDYHPCNVEFFLARVTQRDEPKPWTFTFRSLIPRFFKPQPRTGLNALKEMAGSVGSAATEAWELDVSDLPSQIEKIAWREYSKLLSETENPYELVVYGRIVEGESGRALQYLYFYMYNDFRNNHEGDWEMVAIELGQDDQPLRIGFSAHHGGAMREWSEAPKHEPGSDRPLIYVARGSHAGYFEFRQKGHNVINLAWGSNPPPFAGWIIAASRKIPFLKRWRDATPADPNGSDSTSTSHIGSRVDPPVKVIPEGPYDADSEWWWLNLRCRWGSSHSRFSGTTGPQGPWIASSEDDLSWKDPVGWIKKLDH